MSPPFEFDIGTTTQTEVDENNHISSQVDHYGEENSGVPALESHHPYGFMGRHADPDVDADGVPVLGAQNLHAWEGNTGHTWPQEDPRVQEKLPALKAGETCSYGPLGQFIKFGSDGSISMMTTDDGTPEGRAIVLSLSPTNGLWFNSPWVDIKAGPLGYHVKHSSGARLDLGAIAAPAPLDALGSYANLTAAMVGLQGSAVSTGTTGGLTNELAVATLVTLLGGLAAIIDAKLAVTATAVPLVAAAVALPVGSLNDIGKVT
jgi:hypothetical protein